jgi:hypothetical protein
MVFVSRSPAASHHGLLNPKSAAAAFAFTTSSTVSLYSSLKAGHLNHRHKTRTYQSFRTLLIVFAIVSFAFILPLAFFGSAPFSAVSPHAISDFRFPIEPQDNAKMFPRPLRAALHASTLVLTLPQILVNTPTIPLPFNFRHLTNASISHLVSAVFIFILAAAKPEVFYVISNVTLVLTLVGTYLLPGNTPSLISHLKSGLTLFNSRNPHHITQHPKTTVNHSASANAIGPELSRA